MSIRRHVRKITSMHDGIHGPLQVFLEGQREGGSDWERPKSEKWTFYSFIVEGVTEQPF